MIDEERFLEVARRRGVLTRQVESFAAIKAQREGRSLVEVLRASLPAAAVAGVLEELGAAPAEEPEEEEPSELEEPLEDLVARDGALGLAAFREKHGGVFLFRDGATPMVVRLVGQGGAVTVGSGRDATVRIGGKGLAPVAATIEPQDGGVFDLVAGEGVVYDARRLESGERVRIEEGRTLQLGRTLRYRVFTPIGFFRFLGFRKRLERARKP